MVRVAVAAGTVVLALGLGAVGVSGLAAGPAPGDRASGDRPPGDGPAAAAVVAGPPQRGGPPGVVTPPDPAGLPERPGDDAGSPHARTYVLPLDPPVVVARPFDAPPHPWAAGHRGVDLAAHPAQAVRAPQAGVVTFAGTVVDRGVVTVRHPDGLRSSLEPVAWSVAPGQRVLRGQGLGTVAPTAGHCAPATCLHWGLRRGETYLDPMRWVLDRGPVVLLPTG